MANQRITIPDKILYLVWGKSAGRCHICNTPVYEDSLTFKDVNIGDIAHIIGSSSEGPRGDEKLSKELAKDPSNIMLLCKAHHKLIDTKEFITDYPSELLREIKQRHEERIEIVTSVADENRSHVLLYGANIGSQNNPVNFDETVRAMLPNMFPAEKRPITINLVGNSLTDDKNEFWNNERNNLNHKYATLIKERIERSEISHLSVFALAPIPLLIELGALLTDKTKVEVYQYQREPQNWKWHANNDDSFEFMVRPSKNRNAKDVAVNISLSGTIPDKDITDALGDDVAIWDITIGNVGNDFMKTKEQLSLFRRAFRKTLNDIKALHGRDATIHLFPAIPVSVAIEIGRVWMPKADLPIMVYDRNRNSQLAFSPAFRIG